MPLQNIDSRDFVWKISGMSGLLGFCGNPQHLTPPMPTKSRRHEWGTQIFVGFDL